MSTFELAQRFVAYGRQHPKWARCGPFSMTELSKKGRHRSVPRRDPCIIKGAGVERSAERPIATIAEVDRLVEAADPRLKALILMATCTSLRLGELFALTRRHP
jgi:integrase